MKAFFISCSYCRSKTKNKFYKDIMGLSWESKTVPNAQKSAFYPTAGQPIT